MHSVNVLSSGSKFKLPNLIQNFRPPYKTVVTSQVEKAAFATLEAIGGQQTAAEAVAACDFLKKVCIG